LSGGQRQRIAIARALLRDPSILVLDEATSALDPNTEAAINATLAKLKQNRTVISVTHRLQTVVDQDCVFVLEDGHLVEQGNHDDLLKQDGVYRQLWDKQQGFTIDSERRLVQVTAKRLKDIPIICDLNDDLLDQIANRFVTEHFDADETIIQEGDSGDKFYLIVRGQVEVVKKDANDDDVVLSVLQDGDFFGEIALLHDVSRTATIRARIPCMCLSLGRGPFLNLLDQTPHMRSQFEAIARKRLEETKVI